jgi:hypothetical protein
VVREVAKRVRLVQSIENLLAHALGLRRGLGLLVAQILQHHNKIIAPQPCHRVAFTDTIIQPLGYLLQQHITLLMTLGVVEIFKIIQINEQQSAMTTAARANRQHLLQPVGEQTPIGQPGERIIKSQMLDFSLCGLVPTDVGDRGHIVRHDVVLVLDSSNGQPLGKNLTILAPIPDFTLPRAAVFERCPHGSIKGSVVAPRTEQTWCLSDGLHRGKTGNLEKRLIDTQNDTLGVGDEHAFLRLKGNGRDAQALLRELALGHILLDRQVMTRHPVIVKNGRNHGLLPKQRAILAAVMKLTVPGFPRQQDGPHLAVLVH